MPLPPDQVQRVLAAINGKVAQPWICTVCKQSKWSVDVGGWVFLHAQDKPQVDLFGSYGFPFILVICQVCGNTHFFNLNRLGLNDLAQSPPEQT